MNKVLGIIGASGHGRVIADIAKKAGYERILFFDDNESITSCGGYQMAGKTFDILHYGCDAIVGIGNAQIRRRIQEQLEQENISLVTLIHPNAVIGENVTIGNGSVVMAGAVVNPGCQIGKGCIINTCASVDHDCVLEDYVHVSVGAHLAGTVTVGHETWVGIGATVSNNVDIPCGSMIGAGAVVVKSLEKCGTYVGVPARWIE